MSNLTRIGAAVGLLIVLLAFIAGGLGAGQTSEPDPNLLPWQWGNWYEMPAEMQYRWIHFQDWSLDEIYLFSPSTGVAWIISYPFPGARRIESIFAVLVWEEASESFGEWEARVTREFGRDPEKPHRPVLIQDPHYSLFKPMYLQINYYNIEGEYLGWCGWAQRWGPIVKCFLREV